MELRRDKRGFSIESLQPIVLGLIIVAVLFGAGLYAVSELRTKLQSELADKSSFTANNTLSSLDNVTSSMGDLATWVPIIIVIVAASIVIAIVIISFTGRRMT